MKTIITTILAVVLATSRALNHCESNPCVNGACTNTGDSYSCLCDTFHTGHRCCEDIDDCSYNTCVHGACVDLIGNFSCVCLPGWGGSNCDININECSPSKCRNGGTCVDKLNGYTCSCPAGVTGKNCESPLVDLTDSYVSVATSSNAKKGKAEYGVDNRFSVTHTAPYYCTHTGNEVNPWWSVTLNKVYPIRHVKIYNRQGYGEKFNNILVKVDGQVCATYKQASTNNLLIHMYCPEGIEGKTVRIEKNGPILTLCEVQLFGYISKNNLNF